jgi:hypothetical protein
MKNNNLYIEKTKAYRNSFFISVVTGVLLLFSNAVVAQGAKDTVSQPAGKLSFTMNLSTLSSNGVRTVKILVSRKEDDKPIFVHDVKSPFNLYLNEVKPFNPLDGTGLISTLHLDFLGEGVFQLPADFNKLTDSLHEFNFIVKMDADPKYEDVEESIKVADAKITMVFAGEDSVKSATATLLAWKNGAYVPVPELEVKLCIRRSFNFLLFGEAGAMTDSIGQVSGELPMDLPGNADGTLTIFGRIEDDETYGTVEGGISVPWSVLPKKNPERGRTLWSSGDNAPLILVISSLTIIVIIWGTIFFMVTLLVKIKRLGKD